MTINDGKGDGGPRTFRLAQLPSAYTLRHDVPIPLRGSPRLGRRAGPPATIAPYIEASRRAMLKMQVGDCFLVPLGSVPGKDHDGLLGIIGLQAGYILGRDNFITTAVQDGVMVWRVG